MSKPATDDRGRIVVVTAGFALWRGGRCITAARWSDIRRLRAYRAGDAVALGVDMADGTVLEFHERAPGFDAFLDRASATLSGLLPFPQWHPALVLAPPGGEGTVLFERLGPRR